MKIKAIALNTFREAMRERILYLLLFFALASLVLSRFMAIITVGDRVKIITDVGLASLSLFGALMAILMGTSLVFKEIDKKTIFTLLAKPIHRHQFLLGKYFGLLLTLAVMLFLMTVIFLIVHLLHAQQFQWTILVAVFYIFLELCLITAVAIFFSCFSTPILSSVFSLAFYLIGHMSWGLETLIDKMTPGTGKSAAQILYTFLPDLENFNFKTEVVHHLALPLQTLLFSVFYGFAYTVFVLFLAVLIFRRRDFV
jgi:ABC-type transport system involved in multi-copper enzyme maturation permease subunit